MTNDGPPTVVVTPAQGVVGVATSTVDALRTSPLLLVVVVLNCVMIVAAAWYLRNQQDHAFALVKTMFDRCLPNIHPPSDRQGVYPPSPLGPLGVNP
jgi:hypothetical protein